jgi:hypothetical protein
MENAVIRSNISKKKLEGTLKRIAKGALKGASKEAKGNS